MRLRHPGFGAGMSLQYTLRPISDRSAFTGPPLTGQRNPFEAPWRSTLDLLERELYYLDGKNVVLEIDVRERDIRVDGSLRADARAPASPGARLAFESQHGPLIYGTDRYGWDYSDRPYAEGWKQNVRAIALGMEALRRVDRYGIASRGEQYRGWQQLEAGPAKLTTEQAWQVLRTHAGAGPEAVSAPELYRAAKVATHPDHNGGLRGPWDDVERAAKTLGLI
jgi:hypothetical protein